MYIISQWTDCNTGITVSDSKHSEYELDVSMPSTIVSSLLLCLFGFGTNCRLMSLFPLPSVHSFLDCWTFRRLRRQFRHIHPAIICTLQHLFYLSVELGFSVASSTSCTSTMHDITPVTQHWGMCITGKKKKFYSHDSRIIAVINGLKKVDLIRILFFLHSPICLRNIEDWSYRRTKRLNSFRIISCLKVF